MKNLIITTLVSIICSGVHAQELNQANKDLIEAKTLAGKDSLDRAILKYELAFSQLKYVHSTHICEMISLSKKNKDRSRKKSISVYSERKRNAKTGN